MTPDYPIHGDESDADLRDGYLAYERISDELRHRERLAAIGRLAAGVAHEIGNPVTGIACIAQNLQHDHPNPLVFQAAQDILRQTQRISTILESLLNFTHAGSVSHTPRTETLPVRACVAEGIALLSLDAAATPVSFENACAGDVCAAGDYQKLLQVLINLLDNARAASNPHARVLVNCRERHDHIIIEVVDHGRGIPAELQQRIFEPFFTTKEPGQGTGLGLALAYSLLQEMGGTIRVRSPVEANSGCCFEIQLPQAAQQD